MFKLLFFCFRFSNSRLKNKKIPLQVTNSIGEFLFFHFRVTNVKFIYEKNPLNITVLGTSYNSMSLGFQGMLEKRSDMDVISNRYKSIRPLLSSDIPLGARDIQVQSFYHLTSS